jgi:hypothetical protein
VHSLSRRTLTITLPSASALLLALTGCASPGDGAPGGSAVAAPTPVAVEATPDGPTACDLLGADQVLALAGRDLGAPHEANVAGDDGFPACVWGEDGSATVQVTRVPAVDWAQRLPAMLEQLEATGVVDDAENSRKIREASELVGSGQQVEAGQACDLFSTMLEFGGVGPGQTWTVNIVPNLEAPEALTGQSCADGVFSSVLVMRDGITGAAEEIAAVQEALTAVAGAAF